MLSTRRPCQNKRFTQAESEGMGKKYSMQMEKKEKMGIQYLYLTKQASKQRP